MKPTKSLLGKRQVAFRSGLTFKQAGVTLMAALLLGLLVGALQLFVDWRAMRDETAGNMRRLLVLVEGSAAEAAYQLNPELGRQLVQGLFVFDAIRDARLSDDFGKILAQQHRSGDPAVGAKRWAWLFEGVTRYRLPLYYPVPGGSTTRVGELRVELSPEVLSERFLRRITREAIFGLARSLFISALVVAIFYFMITRPLLRLARAISEVDPERPGRWVPPDLRTHAHDELGLLSEHLRVLLQSSQRGLDQRDVAQRELTALNQQLEQRVSARTAELERALGDLARQNIEVERAFSELDRTHQRLTQANHQLLESHRYARRIQRSMLPAPAVLGDAVREIHVHWEPLHEVGGDWYWIERCGDRCLILLADCTGHGVPGAFITLVVAAALERLLRDDCLAEPVAILKALDRDVRRRLRQQDPSSESDDGLDAAILLWDVGTRRLCFASAGGIPLLMLEPGEPVGVIRGSRGHLGYQSLSAPDRIVEHEIQIRPGATYYLMTDGITDQMGGVPPRLLGRRRVAEWLESHAELSLEAQASALCQMLAEYRGPESRRDDMTLIGVRPR